MSTPFRVIITREAERAEPLISLLASEGIEGVAIPVTTTSTVEGDLVNFPADRYSWVAFTSPNGVRYFHDLLLKLQVDYSAHPHSKIKIATIGGGTADAANKYLGRVDYNAEGKDGQSFIEAFVNSGRLMPTDRILWPCARKTASGFIETMRSNGFKVDPIEVERVLVECPNVRDAGVYSGKLAGTEIVKAVVAPATEAFSVEELLAYCRSRLAPYKTPKSVILAPEIPRDDNGKVIKARLMHLTKNVS